MGWLSKKESIIVALEDLARTKGFYRVTMDELAARAGVSKRTIYRHFRGKDAVIEAVLDRFMARVATEIDACMRAADGPDEIFAGVIAVFYKHGRPVLNPLVLDDLRVRYPGLWEKVDRFRADMIRQTIIKGLVGKYEGRGLRRVNPEILETAFLAAVRAVVNPRFILEHNLTLEATVEELIGIFVHGIAGETPGQS